MKIQLTKPITKEEIMKILGEIVDSSGKVNYNIPNSEYFLTLPHLNILYTMVEIFEVDDDKVNELILRYG